MKRVEKQNALCNLAYPSIGMHFDFSTQLHIGMTFGWDKWYLNHCLIIGINGTRISHGWINGTRISVL